MLCLLFLQLKIENCVIFSDTTCSMRISLNTIFQNIPPSHELSLYMVLMESCSGKPPLCPDIFELLPLFILVSLVRIVPSKDFELGPIVPNWFLRQNY